MIANRDGAAHARDPQPAFGDARARSMLSVRLSDAGRPRDRCCGERHLDVGQRCRRGEAVTFLDADDFYWIPTVPPYRQERARPERVAMLATAFRDAARDGVVLAGSVVGWVDDVVDACDLIVYLTVPRLCGSSACVSARSASAARSTRSSSRGRLGTTREDSTFVVEPCTGSGSSGGDQPCSELMEHRH